MDHKTMEADNKRTAESKKRVTNGLVKHLQGQWSVNLTVLDLSNKQLTDFDSSVVMPPKLINLDISRNNLSYVPTAVIELVNIERLNLSHNNIQYFDETPNFCGSIKELNLSHNNLAGPPYWIWTESPKNLDKIDLSCNMNLTLALDTNYTAGLLEYKPVISQVVIYNCQITKDLAFELLGSFNKVKTLEFGTPDLSKFLSNKITYFPCKDLLFKWSLDIERLNLSNTQLCSIENNIDMYKNLVEINLSQNKINSLPNSFCCLENLEVCILSENYILYLPENITKLKKLVCLHLDSNELCMLPDNLSSLSNLKVLDLYNNSLHEYDDTNLNIKELDLAQNYLDEPDNNKYLEKRRKLRLNIPNRNDGRKHEIVQTESEHSDLTDDEELISGTFEETTSKIIERTSSPEDWDSEEYWVPRYYRNNVPLESPWVLYVRHKMQEGNFCPMDAHEVSVVDKLQYERKLKPKIWTVAEGQFDDLSSDES